MKDLADKLFVLLFIHSIILAGGLWIDLFTSREYQHQTTIKMFEICQAAGKEPYVFEGLVTCYTSPGPSTSIIP